jgi:hypothetical protein
MVEVISSDSREITLCVPEGDLLQMHMEVCPAGCTRATTPSVMTIPAPMLPVVAASRPITLLK